MRTNKISATQLKFIPESTQKKKKNEVLKTKTEKKATVALSSSAKDHHGRASMKFFLYNEQLPVILGSKNE